MLEEREGKDECNISGAEYFSNDKLLQENRDEDAWIFVASFIADYTGKF